jgi:hypothetical protein
MKAETFLRVPSKWPKEEIIPIAGFHFRIFYLSMLLGPGLWHRGIVTFAFEFLIQLHFHSANRHWLMKTCHVKVYGHSSEPRDLIRTHLLQ